MPLALVLALLVVAATAPGASAGERDAARCKAKQSRTVVTTRYVRVFERPGTRGFNATDLYGCLYSRGQRIKLDRAWDDGLTRSDSYDLVTVGGRFVAWRHSRVDVSCKAACPEWHDTNPKWIDVYDLRERQRRRVAADATGDVLVVTTTGGAAWLEQASSPSEPVLGDEFALRAYDRDGVRVLDSGRIDRASVTARGRVVSWVRDGRRYRAKLY
jgi:hypothetical protein